jgi:hypothetical protein
MRVGVDGEDADHGRVQVEGLGPGFRGASVLEQGLDLAGGIGDPCFSLGAEGFGVRGAGGCC